MDKLLKKWNGFRHKDQGSEVAGSGALVARTAPLSLLPQAFVGASNFKLENVNLNVAGGNIVTNNNITHIHNHGSLTVEMHEAFRRLADPKGCAWDPSRVCLPDTRVQHIEETCSWINGPIQGSGSAESFLVAQGAGSGKSALAHSICEKADNDKRLIASFFFSQMNAQHCDVPSLMAAIIRGLCSIGEDVRKQVARILVEDGTLASASPELQFRKIVLPVCASLPASRPYVIVIDALDELRDVSLLKLLRDSMPRLPPTFRIFLTTRPEQRIMMYLEKNPHIRQSSHPMTGELSQKDVEVYIRHRLTNAHYGPSITPELLTLFVEKTEGVFLWAATVLNHLDEAYNPVKELGDIVASKSDHWKESPDGTKQLDDIYERILSQMRWTDTDFVRMYHIVAGALVTLKAPLSPAALAALYSPEGVAIDDVSRICVILRPLLDNTQPLRLLHLSVQQYLTERAPSPYRLDSALNHTKLSKLTLMALKKELNPQNIPILGYSVASDAGDSIKDPGSSGTKVPELDRKSIPEHIWYASRFFNGHTLESSSDQVDDLHVRLIHELLLDPRSILEVTASTGSVVDLGAVRKWVAGLNVQIATPPLPLLAAQSFYGVANSLWAAWRSNEVLKASKEAIEICRGRLAADGPDLSVQSLLVLSMCVTSEAYLFVWPPQNQSCLEISREAIDIVRVLIQESPDRFQRTLMRLLMAHASSLWGLERIEESLQPSLEAVELCRKSASVDQQRYGPDLATALQRLAYKLRAGLRFEETVAVAREGVALRRQILDNDAARSSTNVSSLASFLSLYGVYLTVAGRKEEALAPLKEATDISRQLAASDFREHGRLLASSLTKFACNLSACQKHEEAIRLLAEAIDLIHQGSGDDALDPRLPTPLWALASSLTKLGRAEEGVVPAQEGLAISRNLLKLNPFFKFAVAWALNILTATFNACQRYSEAAPLGKEAIVLYRELAEKNPSLWEKSLGDSEALHDRFYPSDSDLAHSLYTYSVSLAGMGEHDAALKEAKEAVVVLRKMIEKFPDKFQAKLADAVKLVGELEASEKL